MITTRGGDISKTGRIPEVMVIIVIVAITIVVIIVTVNPPQYLRIRVRNDHRERIRGSEISTGRLHRSILEWYNQYYPEGSK